MKKRVTTAIAADDTPPSPLKELNMGFLPNPVNLIPPQYKWIAYVVVILAIFLSGVYTGYDWAATKYKAQITILEDKMKIFVLEKQELSSRLEASLANVRVEVITKYVDRVRVIKEKQYVYRDQVVNVVPNQFQLSSGWVSLHDASARGEDADPTRSADATPSGVEDNQALGVIIENYETCRTNAEQLIGLQEYVKEAQKIVAQANEVLKNKKG
jgi:hypothetical protein